MKKRKNKPLFKKKNISIRSFIIHSFLILIALILMVILIGVTRFYWVKEENRVLTDTEKSSQRLADNLSFYDMDLNATDTTLSADIDELAYFAKGRIMVIAHDYHILKDTYVLKQGDYIISDDVMSVMKGEEKIIKRVRGNYAEVIMPVVKNDQIIGIIVATSSVSELNSDYASLRNRIIILVVGVFVIAILGVIAIARFAVGDINRINEQMYQMSLHEKLEEKGFIETKYLAKNYNDVIKRLSKVDETRQEFVSNVSHELKTPVASMKVLAESLVQNENATAEDYKEFMVDIIDEIDRETSIINDLLTLVRSDKANAKMKYEETNINELLDAVIKTVTPLAKERGIAVNFEKYRDIITSVDATRLSMALSNIVENAVKYNKDNGWIRISLNADHKYFYIKIADSGVGIPEDEKDKVFERFYRVDKARSRDTGGTGLGLAITRSIILAHEGTIRLYSESGKGTTFSIKIPLRQEVTEEKEEKAHVKISGGKLEEK